MIVRIDYKLVAYLRLHIERLYKEPFAVFGMNENNCTVVVSGWFLSDPFVAPVSDAIRRIGSIQHTESAAHEVGLIGLTNNTLIFSESDPILFENYRVEYLDAAAWIRERFYTVYIKSDKVVDSNIFCVNDDIHKCIEFPRECDAERAMDGAVIYLSQVVDTGRLHGGILAPDIREAVGIFTSAYPLFIAQNQLWNYMMGGESRRTSRHCSYISHPNNSQDGIQGPPSCMYMKSRCITDIHSRISSPPDSIVGQGGYEYFHYGIDGFLDEGWGCAYRSMQTILSWYKHNYQNIEAVPSISVIQGILKHVDYSYSDLRIGTKQWIGCLEAAAVLSHMSREKIVCRILHASDINDLYDHLLTTVANHLVEHGSPVMVGAGKFAYSIIGVNCREKSVLVLDPHFTGSYAESHKALENNKFVGWKDICRFFNFDRIQGSFINICISSIGR